MEIWEVLLVSIGLSLDVFAATVCQGALWARVSARVVAIECALFAFWQILALLTGNALAAFPLMGSFREAATSIWLVLSTLIFLGLGVYMFIKASRAKEIEERRQDLLRWKEIFLLAFLTSLDAFFAGMGMAFLDTEVFFSAACIFIVTVVVVIVGILMGYRLGLGVRKPAWRVGGALLTLAGIDVLIRLFVRLSASGLA